MTVLAPSRVILADSIVTKDGRYAPHAPDMPYGGTITPRVYLPNCNFKCSNSSNNCCLTLSCFWSELESKSCYSLCIHAKLINHELFPNRYIFHWIQTCRYRHFYFQPMSQQNRRAVNQSGRQMDIERQSHTWSTCGKTESTGRHLSPTTVFGAGSSLTFPTFPETGTVEDSWNFRNEPGGGGGVETGWDIKVSMVEWYYQRLYF